MPVHPKYQIGARKKATGYIQNTLEELIALEKLAVHWGQRELKITEKKWIALYKIQEQQANICNKSAITDYVCNEHHMID